MFSLSDLTFLSFVYNVRVYLSVYLFNVKEEKKLDLKKISESYKQIRKGS